MISRKTFAKAAAIFLATTLASHAFAIEACNGGYRYTCVVDGDTIWLNGVNYRLAGYDTPEEYTNVCGGFTEIDLARAATRSLIDLLNSNDWQIQPLGEADRYGRVLASLYVNGEDVGEFSRSRRLSEALA